MARLTIAQLREKEVYKLATFKNAEPTEADISEARRNMNSFYRLCALDWNLMNWENDEKLCNLAWVKYEADKAERWRDRLNKVFVDTYGLKLVYCGPMPSIGIVHQPGGGFSEKIERWFYR
jgi:hypothetical protein